MSPHTGRSPRGGAGFEGTTSEHGGNGSRTDSTARTARRPDVQRNTLAECSAEGERTILAWIEAFAMLEADEPSMRALTAARSALHPFRALLDLGAIVGSRSECRITVAMLHDLAVARHEAFRRNRMNWRRLPRGCAA